MAVAIQAQLKDEDPERSRLANQRSIPALGIVATPPALKYDPRLLERVDDFAAEHSKLQTAGTAVGQKRSNGRCQRKLRVAGAKRQISTIIATPPAAAARACRRQCSLG